MQEGAMYFEDFPVGYSFTTDHYLVSKDEIVEFAQQWDPQPFHIDEAAANALLPPPPVLLETLPPPETIR